MESVNALSAIILFAALSLGSCISLVGRRNRRSDTLQHFLTNKSVWITGASSGLGEQLSLIAASSNVKRLILSGRNEKALEKVSDACKASSTANLEVLIYPFDLSNTAARNDAAKILLETIKNVDILINNAGISIRGAAIETVSEVDRKIMETNFFSAVDLSKAVLPGMIGQKYGHIVVVNSVQGKFGIPFRSSYSASKHALAGYFDSLRAELAVYNIGVTSIYPGYIRTNLSLNALTGDGTLSSKMDETTAKGADPGEVARKIWEGVSTGRREIIIAPFDARIACLLRALAPDFLMRVMEKRAKKETKNLKQI